MASAELVKKLRDMTSAGFMNCKKALVECNDDLDAAVDWLRKKGLSSAAKKSGRVTAEGVISVKTLDNYGLLLEVNSETDFVSKNDKFRDFVKNATDIAFSNKFTSVDELKNAKYVDGSSVSDALIALIAVIGENLNIRRLDTLSVKNGVVASYIHSSEFPGMGKIGILVGVESDCSDRASLFELGKKIAMHIAASNPIALNIEALDKSLVERERAIIVEQSSAKAKNEEILKKMVDGRVAKFYEEVVLLEQTFVIDGKTKIRDVIASFEKEHNTKVSITGFKKYVLGEGIEKQESNFAEEVMSQIK